MRYYLVIFLLIFMPLQLSWAVVAAYCQHEQVATTTHLGHHQHQHQAEKTDQGKTKSFSKLAAGAADADCAACHVAATPLLISLTVIHFSAPSARSLSSYHWPANSAPISTIERPQWLELA